MDFGGRGMSRAGVRNCTERDGFTAQMPPCTAVVDHATDAALKGAVTVPVESETVSLSATRKERRADSELRLLAGGHGHRTEKG